VNTIEDRLRDELRAVADRVQPDSLRPLRVSAQRRRATTVRWLAPVTAVVAIAGIAVGVSLARQATSPPAPAAGARTQFYVTMNSAYVRAGTRPGTGPDGSNELVEWATVRDAATGAALTTVRLLVIHELKGRFGGIPLPQDQGIAAASDNRTFAVADQDGVFLLRVTPDGRSGRLTRVPASTRYEDAIALSPDGTRIAIQDWHCPGHNTACETRIRILSVATGTGRTWLGQLSGPARLAWTDNGRQVMFLWGDAGNFPATTYRLLDADAPPGSLLAHSVAMPYPAVPKDTAFLPTATPDGRNLIVVLATGRKEPGKFQLTDYRIVEMSPATGRITAVLYQAAIRWKLAPDQPYYGCQVLSVAGRGVHALVQCPVFGRLDGTKFTPLKSGSVPADLQEFGALAAW
jgi:hypothetical protein